MKGTITNMLGTVSVLWALLLCCCRRQPGWQQW
jgi:hypothetical protein